MYVFFIAEMQN